LPLSASAYAYDVANWRNGLHPPLEGEGRPPERSEAGGVG
jgi:hypothetical protein